MALNVRYRNANDVLPPALIAELQSYHVGLLWIPKPRRGETDRDDLIRRLAGKGVPAYEIAELASLTPRRVRQILNDSATKKNSSQISFFDAVE